MPIYEYRCTLCGHELEALQKFSEAALTACPSCGGDGLVKLVSAAAFQLKGSGWYATDFKGGGTKPAQKPGASDAKSDAGGAKTDAGGAKTDADGAKTDAGGATSDAKAKTKPEPAAPAGGCGSGCACH